AIEHSYRSHPKLRAQARQFLRHRSTFEKTERGTCMQLGIHSVVHSPHEPALTDRIVIKAIQTALRKRFCTFCILAILIGALCRQSRRIIKADFEVPLVLLPAVLAPPISRSAPGTGSGNHIAAHAAKFNAYRAPLAQFNTCRNGRPENTEGNRRYSARFSARVVAPIFAGALAAILRRTMGSSEPAHTKLVGP